MQWFSNVFLESVHFKNLDAKQVKQMAVKLFLLHGIWGKTQTHWCLHLFTSLSTSPDVTQCVTGGPESTKHWKIYDLHRSPYFYKLRPTEEKQLVQCLMAGSRIRFRASSSSDPPLLPRTPNRGRKKTLNGTVNQNFIVSYFQTPLPW